MQRRFHQVSGRILKALIPRRLREKILEESRASIRRGRESRESLIPRVPLTRDQLNGCELLLNREALLSRLPKGGCVAEIGVDRGDFSEMILHTTRPATLHLIDSWDSERYHAGLQEGVTGRFAGSIESGTVRIHRKYSTEAAPEFPDDYFDWIYIDSDHSYSLTREELQAYAPKVKLNGIIAGHDYSMGNWVDSVRYGVIEAVHEFCVEHGWKLVYLTVEPIEMQSFAITRITD
jgi:hypothetical protein